MFSQINIELSPGTILAGGKYTIKQVLGVGGFGITYSAAGGGESRKYAIKELFLSGQGVYRSAQGVIGVHSSTENLFSSFKIKFLEEARLLKDLDHPNIVKVYDVFEENNTCYMVMEYIDGCTLQRYVTNNGCLSYEDTVNVLYQICGALTYIHERNILHRDISPDNVIITPQNKVVLIDFGTARTFIQDKTQRHTVTVKNNFSPLEQYSEVGHKGTYSDIYSLGAVTYYILTSKIPLDCHARSTMRGDESQMPTPSDLVPGLEDAASLTVMKALSLDPAWRQQSAHEYLDDFLGAILEKPSPEELARKAQRKTISKWWAIIPISLGVILFGADYAYSHYKSIQVSRDQDAYMGALEKVELYTDTLKRIQFSPDNPDIIDRQTERIALLRDKVVAELSFADSLYRHYSVYSDGRYSDGFPRADFNQAKKGAQSVQDSLDINLADVKSEIDTRLSELRTLAIADSTIRSFEKASASIHSSVERLTPFKY